MNKPKLIFEVKRVTHITGKQLINLIYFIMRRSDTPTSKYWYYAVMDERDFSEDPKHFYENAYCKLWAQCKGWKCDGERAIV